MHGKFGSAIKRAATRKCRLQGKRVAAVHNGSRAGQSGLDLNQANAYDLIDRARHEAASVRALIRDAAKMRRVARGFTHAPYVPMLADPIIRY